jgi:hypothetical protein
MIRERIQPRLRLCLQAIGSGIGIQLNVFIDIISIFHKLVLGHLEVELILSCACYTCTILLRY